MKQGSIGQELNDLDSLAEERKGSNKKMSMFKHMTSSSWHESLCDHIMKTFLKLRD